MNKEQSFLSVVFFSCSLHLHVRYVRSTYTFSLWVERRNMIVPMMGKEEEGVRCFPQTKPRCLQFANFPRKVSLNTGISSNSRMWETFLKLKKKPSGTRFRVLLPCCRVPFSGPKKSPPFSAQYGHDGYGEERTPKKSFAEYRHNHYIDPGWFPPPRSSRLCGLSSRHHRPGPQYAHAWAARQKEGGWAVGGGKCKNSRIVVIVVVVVVAS